MEAGLGIIAGRDVTDDAEGLALFVYRYPPVRARMQIEPPYDGALESAERGKRGPCEVFVGAKRVIVAEASSPGSRIRTKVRSLVSPATSFDLIDFPQNASEPATCSDGVGDFFPSIPMRRANSDEHGRSLFFGGDGPGYTLARQGCFRGYFFVRACSLFP